jgi:iron(III) transport system substrate-binding protein
VNYSGGGVAAHAQNKANAIALLEYLASPEAQALFPKLNEEFPVVAGVPLTPQLQALGQFKEDDLPLAAMGEHQPQAQALFDRAGWR